MCVKVVEGGIAGEDMDLHFGLIIFIHIFCQESSLVFREGS
jgi:hypothetical protein